MFYGAKGWEPRLDGLMKLVGIALIGWAAWFGRAEMDWNPRSGVDPDRRR